jgi:hypothetical protein
VPEMKYKEFTELKKFLIDRIKLKWKTLTK